MAKDPHRRAYQRYLKKLGFTQLPDPEPGRRRWGRASEIVDVIPVGLGRANQWELTRDGRTTTGEGHRDLLALL